MKNILKLVFFSILILGCDYIFARAGGGGSGGSGSGGIFTLLLGFVLAPFLLIYSVIVSFLLYKKKKKASRLLDKIEITDPIWNHRNMRARIEKIFFEVQNAWSERNQDLAKESMSSRIYHKHKTQTDQMIKNGKKNQLESINLIEASIISVADFKDDSKDAFSAHIKGKMIDYIIDEKTQEVIKGDNTKYESFTEIWHFIREGNKWVLDEIDQTATLFDISNSLSKTE